MKYLKDSQRDIFLQKAMDLDALKSSHPVSVPVNNPDTIWEIFDAISYKKGASIIRMMNHFLGDQTFKEGLTYYLNKLYKILVILTYLS